MSTRGYARACMRMHTRACPSEGAREMLASIYCLLELLASWGAGAHKVPEEFRGSGRGEGVAEREMAQIDQPPIPTAARTL